MLKRALVVVALVLASLPVRSWAATSPSPVARPSPAPSALSGPSSTATPRPGPSPTAPPAQSPVAVDNQSHLYTIDGWGGFHVAAGSPSLASGDYFGWDIARGVSLFPDGTGGYMLDGWGGLHPVGSAARIGTAAYFGWDIARSIVMAPWSSASDPEGWVLDGWGGMHAFGGAPALPAAASWVGWDIARGMVISQDSTRAAVRGWVLDGQGGLHPFPGSAAISSDYFGWDIARSVTLVAGSTAAAPHGYVLDGYGGIHPFGTGTPRLAVNTYWNGNDIARSITGWTGATPSAPGGWIQAGTGELWSFGSAPAVSSNATFSWDIARGSAGAGQGSGSLHRPRPSSRTLPLTFHHQLHALSCEAAALVMALSGIGIQASEDAILGYIGADLRPAQFDANGRLVAWGDPYATFVGNVDGSEVNYTGYGVYYPPVAAAAQHFGAPVALSSEWLTASQIYDAVLDGHPVVAWVGAAAKGIAPGTLDYYTAFDGRRVPYGRGFEHAVAVGGVTPDSVEIFNPLDSGPTWVSRADFEAAWATFQWMAVAVGN